MATLFICRRQAWSDARAALRTADADDFNDTWDGRTVELDFCSVGGNRSDVLIRVDMYCI